MKQDKVKFVPSERFNRALELVLKIHGNQNRKGTNIPYISHVFSVAAITMEFGGDEDQVIAALLHDAVEDGGGEEVLNIIREECGPLVAKIVDECSDTDQIPKPPWRARKEAYLSDLEDVSSKTLLVSIADKIHNVSSIIRDHEQIGPEIWTRFKGKKEGTKWYYSELAKKYEKLDPSPKTDLFSRLVKELNNLD